jgi:hypothetical protein
MSIERRRILQRLINYELQLLEEIHRYVDEVDEVLANVEQVRDNDQSLTAKPSIVHYIQSVFCCKKKKLE